MNHPHDSPGIKLGLTKKETARLAGVGLSAVHEAIQRGELPARRLGRRVIVLRDEAENWLRGLARTSA